MWCVRRAFLCGSAAALLMRIRVRVMYIKSATLNRPTASCEHVITANTPDESLPLTSIKMTVNKDLQPIFTDTPDYPSKHKTGPIEQGEMDKWYLLPVTRTIQINEIPDWAWTKATPYDQVKDNYAKLQQAYFLFHDMMNAKDIQGIRAAMDLSLQEQAFADNSDPDSYFASFGFDNDFEEGYKTREVDWSRFKVETFANGKLVRLFDENTQSSPWELFNNGRRRSYNSYLAYLNGKFVIVR